MSIGNIDLKRWKDGTATWKLRSAKLRAVDNAIKAYCASGGGTPGNLATLNRAFSAWKASKEDWTDSARNRTGIVQELQGYLSGAVPMTNAYLDSQADGRLGMLYVFGGLKVDTKLFNLIVESVWDAGSAAFGFDQTQEAISNSMGDASDLLKEKISGAPSMFLDSGLVQKGRDKVLEKIGNRGNVPPPPVPPKPAWKRAAPSQLGGQALGGTFQIKAGIVSSAGFEQPSFMVRASAAVNRLIALLRQQLHDFSATVWNTLKKKFDEFKEEPFDFMKEWGSRLATVINFIVSKVAAQAAPFVGAAFEIAEGLADTVKACASKYETYILGKNVNMSPGQAQAVEDAIHLIQSVGIGKGLYASFKGAGQLAIDSLTGVGGIVGLVISCCEILAKFIHRLWDTSRMKSFAEKCSKMYDAAKASPAALPRAGEFGVFLRGYLLTCPTLACLGLVSNFAGDAMQWLDMNSTFNRAQSVSAQDWKQGNAQFDAAAKTLADGQKYLLNLKKTARSYLLDSGFDFDHKDPSLKFYFSSAQLAQATIPG